MQVSKFPWLSCTCVFDSEWRSMNTLDGAQEIGFTICSLEVHLEETNTFVETQKSQHKTLKDDKSCFKLSDMFLGMLVGDTTAELL